MEILSYAARFLYLEDKNLIFDLQQDKKEDLPRPTKGKLATITEPDEIGELLRKIEESEGRQTYPVALALQTAQALVAVCQTQGKHDDSDKSEVSPESGSGDLKPPFEIRSCKIPDYILREEQDLLKKTKAHDLRDALNKVYAHLNSIAHLMQYYAADEERSGVSVHDLAQVLSVPLDWLEMFCSTITGFRLVHHRKTE